MGLLDLHRSAWEVIPIGVSRFGGEKGNKVGGLAGRNRSGAGCKVG